MLEGANKAARVFESRETARRSCVPLQSQVPMPITYEQVVHSLLHGSAFCFDTEDGHARFLKRLRNDPGNKPFVDFSRNREFVRWRHSNEKHSEKPGVGARVVGDVVVKAVPAEKPPLEVSEFNASILVREGNSNGP